MTSNESYTAEALLNFLKQAGMSRFFLIALMLLLVGLLTLVQRSREAARSPRATWNPIRR